MPLFYKLTPQVKKGVRKRDEKNAGPKVIVSLTTFPPRVSQLWLVLESLLRQTYKPDKIILWLAKSQFESINMLDERILKMQKRGLEIQFCDDLKSHKKYYYAMEEYSGDIIITVDDDIFQPENLVGNLMNKYIEFPNCVVCYRAHKITFADYGINEYDDWDLLSKTSEGPDHLLMATNGAGALYPPNCLSKEVLKKNMIKELCFEADDIWLKCMSFMGGTKTVKVCKNSPRILTVKGSSENGLAKDNVINKKNDFQLKSVMQHYGIDFRCSDNY
ncbi:hypothetical protein B481_1035 [Planococcus halocryophilus Or1]|uniref:hypothetical protein n=1 Tax=Planococcus halocryophilus TaxID=1215089 RepID=UPI0002B8518D|nr:hypothetical protein [Planococcus halocryophilus]EMF47447.1 hypothetical protein B481_1035 [Planococcus halocryophilus Or1]